MCRDLGLCRAESRSRAESGQNFPLHRGKLPSYVYLPSPLFLFLFSFVGVYATLSVSVQVRVDVDLCFYATSTRHLRAPVRLKGLESGMWP